MTANQTPPGGHADEGQMGYTRLPIPLPGALRIFIDIAIASAVLSSLAAAFWYLRDRGPDMLNGGASGFLNRALNGGLMVAIAFCLTQIAGGIAIVLGLLCRPRLRKYNRRPLAVVLVFTTLLSIAAVLLTWFA